MVCKENTSKSVFDVLHWFGQSTEFKIYRAELFYRIRKIYAYMVEENTTLYETIEALEN